MALMSNTNVAGMNKRGWRRNSEEAREWANSVDRPRCESFSNLKLMA